MRDDKINKYIDSEVIDEQDIKTCHDRIIEKIMSENNLPKEEAERFYLDGEFDKFIKNKRG